MVIWRVAAMLGASLIVLVAVFGASARILRNTSSDALKNAIEVIKVFGLLLVASFTFVFIDRQRQELSQAEYDFKVYQALLEASNAQDLEAKLRVLNNITTYRQNFLKPGSRLDNALVSLSKTLVDERDVQVALTAPANTEIASALASDRSSVLRSQIQTLDDVLGPIKEMTLAEREKWAESQLVYLPLPFPIKLGFDLKTEVRRVRVHRAAAPFFASAFAELQSTGLHSAIRTFDGASNTALKPRGGVLSAHVYGTAIDLNMATNRLGTAGDMDPRVVALFKRNGFVWGGDWDGDIKNPAHFEVTLDALTGKTSAAQP